MNDLDFHRYKVAWKEEKAFQKFSLSKAEIQNYMNTASKTLGQYQRVIFFDIGFKIVLLLSFVAFIVFFHTQLIALAVNALFLILTLSGLIWQSTIYKKITDIKFDKPKLKDNLEMLINFNNKHFIKSLFISALSSTLLFLGGSMYYMQLKYGAIPPFELDDFTVMTIGIIFSYGLSAFSQLSQHNYKMKQLEQCLIEIKENTITFTSIKKHNFSRMKNTILIGLYFIVGFTLFLFLIYKLNT